MKKRDIHPGNVLLDDIDANFIGDLGLSILQSEANDIKEIQGVMPYLAPELFNGGAYSQASDVYAFGIIMWEISSEEKPFHDIAHDKVLALRICQGCCPEITKDTPLFYRNLMQKCWHSDPTQRPTAEEIKELTIRWFNSPTQEIQEQLNKAEEIRKRYMSTKKVTKDQHPGAIYTSRIMPNITKGEQMLCLYLYKRIPL